MLLAAEPKLLMLEEPTEGMQPSIVQEIEAVIRSLKGRMSILLFEQFAYFAEAVADQYVVLVLVLVRGQVVAKGLGSAMAKVSMRALIAV